MSITEELIGLLRAEIDSRGLAHRFSVRYEPDGDRVALVRTSPDGSQRAIHYPAELSSIALVSDFLRIEERLAAMGKGHA